MKKIIVVAYPLGRTGSSAVMGLIKNLGVYIGNENEMSPAADMNPKGFFELKDQDVFLRNIYKGYYPDRTLQTPTIRYLENVADKHFLDFEAFLTDKFNDYEICAIKSQRMLLLPLFNRLKASYDVKVIFLTRDEQNQINSIDKVWKKTFGDNYNKTFIQKFLSSWKSYAEHIKKHYNFDYLELSFEEVVNIPLKASQKISLFIDYGICNQQKIEDWIDPKLVNRNSNDKLNFIDKLLRRKKNVKPKKSNSKINLIYSLRNVINLIKALKNIFLRHSQPKPSRQATGRMAIRDKFDDVKNLLRNCEAPKIIDGGANSGGTIMNFLKVFQAPIIYSFEPNPKLAEFLKNKFGKKSNIEIFQQAIGNLKTSVDFNITNYDPSASVLKPSKINKGIHKTKMDIAEVIQVEQVRLDEVFKEKIDIIKLDLQGYELNALQGCTDIIENVSIILTEVEFIELYEEQALFSDIAQFLKQYGFELYNLYDLYTQESGQLTSGDAIFINKRLINSLDSGN